MQKFWNNGAISGIGGVTGLHELGKRGLKQCRSPLSCPTSAVVNSKVIHTSMQIESTLRHESASDSGESVTEFGVHGRHMAAPLAVR